MHKTILIEEITIENVTEKINEKVQEMEKDGYQIKTMSFWGTDKAVLIFKKVLYWTDCLVTRRCEIFSVNLNLL